MGKKLNGFNGIRFNNRKTAGAIVVNIEIRNKIRISNDKNSKQQGLLSFLFLANGSFFRVYNI